MMMIVNNNNLFNKPNNQVTKNENEEPKFKAKVTNERENE